MAKRKPYYQWRDSYVKNRNRQIEFIEWLVDKGADIHTNLDLNEVVKFQFGNQFGFLWRTGYCNPLFNEYVRLFKSSIKKAPAEVSDAT